MNQNRFSETQWESLHEEIQRHFRTLADEMSTIAPAVKPHFNKTATELFPLFSYLSFHLPNVDEAEYIIVGVDIGLDNGQWRIDADICDEEEGTIYFELPRTPFSVANFDELKHRVLHTTDQLISGGKPVLLKLLSERAPVMPTPPGVAPEVTQKA
jgi:hypothetical protein